MKFGNDPSDIPAVIQFLRAMTGTAEDLSAALGDVDWQELRVDAGRHGLSGVLYSLVGQGLAIPEPFKSQLRTDSLAIAAGALRVRALLVRALDALVRYEIKPILLKGYGLAQRLYPDPLMRPVSDVDLLVSPDRYRAAEQALLEIGLRRTRSERPEEARKDHHAPNFWGHENWFSGDAGLVELHWRPLSGFGTAIGATGAFARRRAGELEGRSVYYLSAEDELPYLAAHAAKHLLGRLSWLYDIKLLIHTERTIDWQRVLQNAVESEMTGPVYFALEAAQRALGAAVPEFVLNGLGAPRWQKALAPALFSEKQLARSPFADRKYTTYLLIVLLASNFRTRSLATWALLDQARQRMVNHYLPQFVQQMRQSYRDE